MEPAEEKVVVVVSPEPGTEATAKPEGQTDEKVQDKEIEKAKEEKPKHQVEEDKSQEMQEDKKEDEKEEEEGKPGQDNKKDDLEELGEETIGGGEMYVALILSVLHFFRLVCLVECTK